MLGKEENGIQRTGRIAERKIKLQLSQSLLIPLLGELPGMNFKYTNTKWPIFSAGKRLLLGYSQSPFSLIFKARKDNCLPVMQLSEVQVLLSEVQKKSLRFIRRLSNGYVLLNQAFFEILLAPLVDMLFTTAPPLYRIELAPLSTTEISFSTDTVTLLAPEACASQDWVANS